MSALRPETRQRALAVGLLVLVVGALAAAVAVPAVLLHRHYDEAIATSTDRIERFRRVAAQRSEYLKALEAVKASGSERFFLQSTAPNLAGAELQDLVRSAAENNGARITTLQIGTPRDEGGFRQFTLSTAIQVNAATLPRVLHALEAAQPYLIIDGLKVTTTIYRGFRASPGAEPDYSLVMDVSAFALPGAVGAGRPAPAPASPGRPAGAAGAPGAPGAARPAEAGS